MEDSGTTACHKHEPKKSRQQLSHQGNVKINLVSAWNHHQSALDNCKENPVTDLIDTVLKANKWKPRMSVIQVLEPIQQIAPTSYLGQVMGNPEGLWMKDSDSSSSNTKGSSSSSPQSEDGSMSRMTMSSLSMVWSGSSLSSNSRKWRYHSSKQKHTHSKQWA